MRRKQTDDFRGERETNVFPHVLNVAWIILENSTPNRTWFCRTGRGFIQYKALKWSQWFFSVGLKGYVAGGRNEIHSIHVSELVWTVFSAFFVFLWCLSVRSWSHLRPSGASGTTKSLPVKKKSHYCTTKSINELQMFLSGVEGKRERSHLCSEQRWRLDLICDSSAVALDPHSHRPASCHPSCFMTRHKQKQHEETEQWAHRHVWIILYVIIGKCHVCFSFV